MFVYQSEVGWQIFQSSIFLFIFFKLPGSLVRFLLWNVVWDKRSGDPETQWPPGEVSFSLFPYSICVPVCLLLCSKLVFPPCVSCSRSVHHLLVHSVRLLYFDVALAQVLFAWPLSSFFLFPHTHIKHGYILQQHTLVHAHNHTNLKHKLLQAGMCGNLPLATSVTCIWSWWGAKKATDPGD